MVPNSNQKKTLALAFSGASSRSVFYIGFLEVLDEAGIKIDHISAISGGAIVAASFASGTLQELKQLAFSLDRSVVFSLIEKSGSKGGIYQLDKFIELLRYFTKNKSFEEVKPSLTFVASDIAAGQQEVMQVGDLAKAVAASCTLPGIFRPMEWGSKQLVDGGIVSVVPGDVARLSGADVVIGVDMRATRFIFSKWQMLLRRFVNASREFLWPHKISQLWEKLALKLDYRDFFLIHPNLEREQEMSKQKNLFSVLGKSLDLAIESQQNIQDENFNCDLVIVPETPSQSMYKRTLFLHFTDFSNTQGYYNAGRKTAQNFLPQIKQMLN